MKNISDIAAEVAIEYYAQFPTRFHEDMLHTQEVATYTRYIAVGENIEPHKIELLVAAAWLHDIGCPRSTQIYGNSRPVNQQNVGREVVYKLLANHKEIPQKEIEWLAQVVGTHHQFKWAKELEFIPLFEADIIVNLLSGYFKEAQKENLFNCLITSNSGKKLFGLCLK